VEEECDVDEAALVEPEEIALLTATEKKKEKHFQRERGQEVLMDTDSWHIQPFGGQGRRLARPKYI
jgi:hypothetical protein